MGKKQTSVFSLRLRRLAGRVHSVSSECFPSDALGCYSRRMHWQSHPGGQINTAQHNECKKVTEDEHCSLSPHLTCCLQVWKRWKLFGHSWRSAAATSRPLALVSGSNSENSVLIHETDCVHSLNTYFTERATGTILSALCFRLKLWEWHSLYVTHI